jgi:hypothetical protein
MKNCGEEIRRIWRKANIIIWKDYSLIVIVLLVLLILFFKHILQNSISQETKNVLSGVILGWFLKFFSDSLNNTVKKFKKLNRLLRELEFNQNLILYQYEGLLSPFFKGKDVRNIVSKISIAKEIKWSFKKNAYLDMEEEGLLYNLVCAADINFIYQQIQTLEKIGMPELEDNKKWKKIIKTIKEIKRSLGLVINNFYKNKKEYIKARENL